MRKPVLHVVRTQGLSILRQLQLEEALLRADPERRNWCVLNCGTPEPAVVMGISGYAFHEDPAPARAHKCSGRSLGF